MILSMTGYGSAVYVQNGVSYSLELKSLNHRYVKLAIKLPEALQFAEPAVEKLLRNRISRGSVSYTLRTRFEGESAAGSINVAALQGYLRDLARVKLPEGFGANVDLAVLATLPGVCQPLDPDDQARREQLDVIDRLSKEAIDALMEMRRAEGLALRGDILATCTAVRDQLSDIEALAGGVVNEYHDRLRTRVDQLLQKGGIKLEEDGLTREVAIYAERCDINEELTRLRTHLDQFAELCDRAEPVGRTLDFLAQELLREANTIASKSNNAQITRNVVEMKGRIDRLKEQLQNVE